MITFTIQPAAFADTPPTGPVYAGYHALTPQRILDTRSSLGGHFGQFTAGQTFTLKVAGSGGVPSQGVSAVALVATALTPLAAGELQIGKPKLGQVVYPANGTTSDLVVVVLTTKGTLAVTSTAATDVTLDVEGYYDAFSGSSFNPALGAQYSPLAPQLRILDTATGLGIPVAKLANGSITTVQVAGIGGVPTVGLKAVAVDITVSSAQTAGAISVYAPGAPSPNTVAVQFGTASDTTGLAMAPVSASGTISIALQGGPANIALDLVGYGALSGNNIVTGQGSVVAPTQVLNTKKGVGARKGKLNAGASITFSAAGVGAIPTIGVASVLLNLRAVAPTQSTHLVAYASSDPRPIGVISASAVAGRDSATLVSAPVDFQTGDVTIYNSAGSLNLIAHVVAWTPFVIPPPPGGVQPPPTAMSASPLSASAKASAPPVKPVSGGKQDPREIHRFWRNYKAHGNSKLLSSALPVVADAASTCLGDPSCEPEYAPQFPLMQAGFQPSTWYSNRIGRLVFTEPNGAASACTATMIARNAVFTAGHCVYELAQGNEGFQSNFMFVPGLRGTSEPLGEWAGIQAWVYPTFCGGDCTPGNETDLFAPADFAIVILEQHNGADLGSTTGWYHLWPNSPATTGWVQGYPAEGWWSDTANPNNASACSLPDQSIFGGWLGIGPCNDYYGYGNLSAWPSWGSVSGTNWYTVGWGWATGGGASGGPLLEPYNGQWYVASVVSHGLNLCWKDAALVTPLTDQPCQQVLIDNVNQQLGIPVRWWGTNAYGPYLNSWAASLVNTYTSQ